MGTYDVFITCKSEDYGYAERIYDFLTAHGIKVFLASKELRRLGESEYRKAISSAMQQAYHLIIFASKAEYIDSTWVYYEWDMFVNAKLKGYKPGNIITILKGVKTDDINMDLWKYESLKFEEYESSVLRYVQTPQSIENRKRIEAEKKKEEEERLRKEAEANKQNAAKNEFIETAEVYQKRKAALSVDVSKMRALLKTLGVTTIKCPVCNSDSPVDDIFCEHCGWPLSLINGIEELRYLDNVDPRQLEIHQKLYADALANRSDAGLHERVELLENVNSELKKEIEVRQAMEKKSREKSEAMQQELAWFKNSCDKVRQEKNDLQGRLSELETALKEAGKNPSHNSKIYFGEWALVVVSSLLTPLAFIYWLIVFATRRANDRFWDWNMRHKGLLWFIAVAISVVMFYLCIVAVSEDEAYQDIYNGANDTTCVIEYPYFTDSLYVDSAEVCD